MGSCLSSLVTLICLDQAAVVVEAPIAGLTADWESSSSPTPLPFGLLLPSPPTSSNSPSPSSRLESAPPLMMNPTITESYLFIIRTYVLRVTAIKREFYNFCSLIVSSSDTPSLV
ncbi:hypothetical protein T439DRAFT_131860 [Meredithblackwellia eburnea MCA 4105]